jgi:hypothetical protein
LKKTCRKHGISFWNYLIDRTSGSNLIPSMAEILQTAACGSRRNDSLLKTNTIQQNKINAGQNRPF